MTGVRININVVLPHVFLFCFSFLPLINLLWQVDYGIIKGNWILYPFIFLTVVFSIILKNKASHLAYYLIAATLFYCLVFAFNGGQYESLLRIFFSFLPLVFLNQIREYQSVRTFRFFVFSYCLSITVPIVISFLQLAGKYPYYEFDVVNGVWGGRISGGYNKPNNFIAILFPLFLIGYHLCMIRRRRVWGASVMLFALGMVYITHLRTAMIIFIIILFFAVRPDSARKFVVFYYRYCLNFIIGISAMIFFCVFYIRSGTVEGLRGRIPMWQANSYNFIMNSSPLEIFFGKGQVLLPEIYKSNKMIGSLEEAHDNSFRTIITFGVVGFLLYCLFMRRIVLYMNRQSASVKLEFIYFSCFIFLMLYSITNEVGYYTSVLWSVLIWIFLKSADDDIVEADFSRLDAGRD